MKRSGMTRLLAMCLAVISLSMLVSGLLGMRAATKEKKKDEIEIQDLQNKIDDFREVSARLMDSSSYDSMDELLNERQDQYDTDAAHHRNELTAYTAINGSLEMGAAALGQAQAALTAGKAQYEAGLRTIETLMSVIAPMQDLVNALGGLINAFFENGIMDLLSWLVDDIILYEYALDNSIFLANTLTADLDRLMGELLLSLENESIVDVASLDSAGNVLTDADNLHQALDEVTDAYNTIQSDLSDLNYFLQAFSVPLSEVQTALSNAGIQDADDLMELISLVGDDVLTAEQYDVINQFAGQDASGLSALYEVFGQAYYQMEDRTSLIGLIYQLQDELSAIQYRIFDNSLSNEDIQSLIALCQQYLTDATADSLMTAGIVEALNMLLPELDQAINSASAAYWEFYEQLNEYTSLIEEAYAALDEAGAQIAAGEAALASGEEQLKASREEQKKKAEELDREKRDLDELEKILVQTGEETKSQKKLEEREKALRSALLAREEIRRKTQFGQELLPAAESWLISLTELMKDNYRDRYDASVLMIVCAILAFAGMLTCFGPYRNLVFTLSATLLCQSFAFAVIILLFRMGRGISWSALITIILATAELCVLIPGLTAIPIKVSDGRTGPAKKSQDHKQSKQYFRKIKGKSGKK